MVAIRVDTAGLTAVAGTLQSVPPDLRAAGSSARRVPSLQQPNVAAPLAVFTDLVGAVCDACADDTDLVGRKVRDAADTYGLLDLILGGLTP